jgi:hypothetical protein
MAYILKDDDDDDDDDDYQVFLSNSSPHSLHGRGYI